LVASAGLASVVCALSSPPLRPTTIIRTKAARGRRTWRLIRRHYSFGNALRDAYIVGSIAPPSKTERLLKSALKMLNPIPLDRPRRAGLRKMLRKMLRKLSPFLAALACPDFSSRKPRHVKGIITVGTPTS
jgi:hypothetical protein